MKRIGAVVIFAGAVLVSTHILAPAAPPPGPAADPVADLALAVQQTAPAVDAVDAQVDRLRERLTHPPTYPAPTRDPFRFGARADVAKPKAAAPADALVERPALIEAAPPLPRLVAIATAVVDGALVRTAALSTGDDLQILKPGDRYSTFAILAVGVDAVELVETDTGKTFRITLQ